MLRNWSLQEKLFSIVLCIFKHIHTLARLNIRACHCRSREQNRVVAVESFLFWRTVTTQER